MRKFFLVLSVMLYTTAAFAQEKENILYILDGKIVSKADLDKVNPACIKSANVVKGFDKAMIITTGESLSRNRNCDFAVVGINSKDTADSSTVTLRSKEKLPPKILYVIKDSDGNIFSPSTSTTITPEQIKSMMIIRDGNKALEKFKQYGDTSKGVIYIELK